MSMLTVKLNDGRRIPQIGLGVFQNPDGRSTRDSVRWALEAGCRHIDTAAVYGNEESVGEGLRESGVPRDEVFVTTKLWNADIRAGKARQGLETSLAKLGLDHVDLYLIHWPAQGWQQAWRDMEKLYDEGLATSIGVSNFQKHHIEEMADFATVKPAVDQIESHPYFANAELVEFCQAHGIDVEAWSPLGGTGGPVLADPALAGIAAKHGKSPAQVVIRWHVQRGVIVLPKSTHRERIEQNLAVDDLTLDEQDMAAIAALDKGHRLYADPDHFDF